MFSPVVGSLHPFPSSLSRALCKTPVQFSRNPFRVPERETQTLTLQEILEGLTHTEYRKSLYPEAIGYWQRHLKALQECPSQTRLLSPTPVILSQAQFVDWGTYRIAAQATPLMTAGLFSCSAINLYNPNTQKHLLMHPFPSSNLSDIQNILKAFMTQGMSKTKTAQTLQPIKATIIPGLLEDANWSAKRLKEAVESASHSTGLTVQSEWASFHPEDSLLGLYSHMGKTLDLHVSAYNNILPFIANLSCKTLGAYDGSKTQITQGQ